MSDNMFGKLLTRVQAERKSSRERTIADLWRRNKLNPNANGYKLAETQIINRQGAEITEYRLYQLVDCTVVTITSEVTAAVETGLRALPENKR